MDLRAIRNPALAPQLRRDLLEYERATGLSDTTLFNLPRTLDGLERTLEARRIIGREREQRLASAHLVTRFRMQIDACRVLHGVLGAGAAHNNMKKI